MCCNNSYSWWSIWHFPSFRFSSCSIALVLGKEKNARVFWLDLFCRVRLHTHADSTHIEFVHVYIRIFADRIIFQIIWCINLRLCCCCWGQKCFGRHPWIWSLLPVTSWPVFSLGWWGLKAVALTAVHWCMWNEFTILDPGPRKQMSMLQTPPLLFRPSLSLSRGTVMKLLIALGQPWIKGQWMKKYGLGVGLLF